VSLAEDGAELRFTLIDDPCQDRVNALAGGIDRHAD
jgi:hypothetical protein